ncbi:MAG: GTP 3',8-cyclase MoaA [Candidatus Altiarchaeales archaeon]|nr:GTP 3',8-cyclase MoaA [Candidatus Altiarchaeota archaeon]MBU4341020.1 GTP 3',8-cyclase MoaA [Candidatus Altiarchaeota archaeon]MBU4437800.1 GTP 3',8-cyclase MoaA [Candidatus Altiarchaeota archaeon]MCG2782064.1 GTP 3',8-cyclase MoaA [Candidatus Altiarchaeales archaeon]
MAKLSDSQGITNLRVSVTQRCNLNCIYCHREGENGSGREMNIGEIGRIVDCAAEIGIRGVKITGGEPLMREDIADLIECISNTDGIDEVSMTTNGTLLENLAKPLKHAGLDRVNIGCDSLSRTLDKNRDNILPGLLAAKKAGLTPIKLNMVVLSGVNDHEIGDMIGFAREHRAILQLIELIPLNKPVYDRYKFALEGIENELSKNAKGITTRKMQSRKQYILDDVVVEVVRPSREFCMNCNKIRLTSDGKLKPCLMRDDNLVDTNNGKSLNTLFLEAINKKEPYYEN